MGWLGFTTQQQDAAQKLYYRERRTCGQAVVAFRRTRGGNAMRTLMQIAIPVEAGNKAARTGAFGKPFKKILDAMKPEAAYFTTTATGEWIHRLRLEDTSQIPAVAEPFFLAYNARVKFFP
jgi:hypothetical protein